MAKNLILAKAQNAVMAHDWATAARLYKELLRGNESNVDYLKELGSIYVKAGEDEKAIPYYEQIITFYPHYIEAMNSLGAIYRRLKRYEESISILQRALDEGRDIPAVYYNLGFTYKEMGNYEDAIDSFETVITENPDDVLAYNHLGSIYFTEKDYEKSIASFKRGLQVDPNHPILNYNLARCYEADKNYTEAIRCYEATLKTRPGWTDAIRDFSGVLIKCQNNKKAQTLVEKSIKLHPTDVDLLCILGRIFLNQFDFENATKTYKKANSLDSNNIKVLVGFSEALEKGDKAAEALDKALEAIEIDPYNKDVRKQYAHTLISNQRYEQAYETLMALNEETKEMDPQVLDLCAQYYICRGDEQKAKAYHEKIVRVNHHYKDYMLNASCRYMQIGDIEKAEENAKAFVERRSQLADGYNQLGVIYQAKGDMKSAKLNFEKGKKICEPNVVADKGLKTVSEELIANPDKYNFETPAIEVNGDEVKEEEKYIPQSFIGEVVGAETEEEQIEETEGGDFDYSQMGDSVPMGEALLEKDNDFWEDFDDDPNAEPKELVDEESVEDEESEDDFDKDIFDTLGGSDPSNEMLDDDDGEFDFGPSVGDDSSDDDESVLPEEKIEDEEVEETAPEPEIQPVQDPAMTQPVQSPYETPYGQQLQSAALGSADRAMDMAVMTQKMVQKLADQQKEFEENIALKNEKMIHEEVEKAVEEKIQSSMDSQMERIMGMDEKEDMDDFLTTDDIGVEETEVTLAEDEFLDTEDFAAEEEDTAETEDKDFEVQEDDFITVDELAGEEAAPVENPFAEADEFFGEVDEFIGEQAELYVPEPEIEPEDDFDSIEDFAGVDDFAMEDETTGEESVEDEIAEDSINDELADDFDSVEDFAFEEETAVEDSPVEETSVEDSEISDDDFGSVEDFAAPAEEFEEVAVETEVQQPEEENVTEEPEGEKNEQLELFKTLRVLSNFLPANEKDSFLSCRIRMMIEYIIARMSGKPGLLITAKALLESGALGEDYDSQLTKEAEDDLSNAMITHVLKYMKKLASSLEDETLSKALCMSADNILERIELEDVKSQIF